MLMPRSTASGMTDLPLDPSSDEGSLPAEEASRADPGGKSLRSLFPDQGCTEITVHVTDCGLGPLFVRPVDWVHPGPGVN